MASRKFEMAQEARIIKATIRALLAAGYTLDVNDGEETTLEVSTSARAVFAAMRTTDEDYLIARKDGKASWVRFVYGNSPWEVICDYTVSLEDVLIPVNKLADKIEEMFG